MCEFLITDKISMAGAMQFSAMSTRAGEAKGDELHFGDIGVFLCGGFSQLRPIERKTLIAPISPERDLGLRQN